MPSSNSTYDVFAGRSRAGISGQVIAMVTVMVIQAAVAFGHASRDKHSKEEGCGIGNEVHLERLRMDCWSER